MPIYFKRVFVFDFKRVFVSDWRAGRPPTWSMAWRLHRTAAFFSAAALQQLEFKECSCKSQTQLKRTFPPTSGLCFGKLLTCTSRNHSFLRTSSIAKEGEGSAPLPLVLRLQFGCCLTKSWSRGFCRKDWLAGSCFSRRPCAGGVWSSGGGLCVLASGNAVWSHTSLPLPQDSSVFQVLNGHFSHVVLFATLNGYLWIDDALLMKMLGNRLKGTNQKRACGF